MKKLISLLSALALICSLAACGASSSPSPSSAAPSAAAPSSASSDTAAVPADIKSMNIMIAHCDPEDMNDPYHHTASIFAQKLKELSGGKITATVYPNAQLGDERSVVEQVQNGSVDATVVTNAVASNFSESAMLLDLPFMFDNLEEARAVTGGEYGQQILDHFSTTGIKALAFSENGFRYILNNVNEVKSPDDLKGLKIRVMQSPVYLSFYGAVNSSAIAMAFGEVYTGLSQKVVDGFDLPMPVILSAKLYEVSKYMSDVRYTYTPLIICVNQSAWDSWNNETQKVFMDAAQAARASCFESNNKVVEDGLATIEAAGVACTAYEDVDSKAFREMSRPIWEQYAKTPETKALLDSIVKTVEGMR